MYTCREIHLLDRYSVSYSWYNIYFSLVLVNLIMKSKWKQVCFLSFVYYVLLLGVQLSKGEGWNPVIKRGGLGSSHQKGRVGIQLSKGQGWDPINWFNPTIFSYACTQMSSFKMRGDCLFW